MKRSPFQTKRNRHTRPKFSYTHDGRVSPVPSRKGIELYRHGGKSEKADKHVGKNVIRRVAVCRLSGSSDEVSEDLSEEVAWVGKHPGGGKKHEEEFFNTAIGGTAMTEKTKQILSYVVYGVILAIIAAAIIILPSLTKQEKEDSTPTITEQGQEREEEKTRPPRTHNFFPKIEGTF